MIAAADGQSQEGPVIEIYPQPKIIDSSIPDRARAYLTQAAQSLHSPSGAVMLAASAVDAMLKFLNYKEGSLNARIEEAKKAHLITAEMAEWAHDVRLDANDERHADEEAALPTPDDAQHSLDFALALAEFLFVLPARVKRGLAAAASEK